MTTVSDGAVRLEWGGREYDAEGWRRQFRAALDRRINLKAGPEPCWRELDPDYQRHLALDAAVIRARRERRVALHYLRTPELRRRFGYLISRWDA